MLCWEVTQIYPGPLMFFFSLCLFIAVCERASPHQCPVGGMKYMQQWTLESGIRFFLLMLISSCRYASYWSLMNFMMGCQLERGEKGEGRKQGSRCWDKSVDRRRKKEEHQRKEKDNKEGKGTGKETAEMGNVVVVERLGTSFHCWSGLQSLVCRWPSASFSLPSPRCLGRNENNVSSCQQPKHHCDLNTTYTLRTTTGASGSRNSTIALAASHLYSEELNVYQNNYRRPFLCGFKHSEQLC